MLNTSRSPSSLGLASKICRQVRTSASASHAPDGQLRLHLRRLAEVAGLLSSGKIWLGPLITYRFPLHRLEDAYQALLESDGHGAKSCST
jgi:threonine dehydrogenase-like Zn-dependent dehydrogenase